MLQLLFMLACGFVVGFRSRRDLVLENLVLRHQLQVALRTNPTPRLNRRDRVLWVWIDRLWPASRRHLLIVRPETVLRWHRKGWRLYWTWRSRGRIGRPRLPAEVKDLIAQISRDNRLWGTERIRGELLKLGLVVSNRSIRRYRWRKPRPEGSQAWRTFLRNHLDGIWAADLFVVQTVGYRVLSSSSSAIAAESLIVINERHLTAVLREFVDYYNHDRPHRTLALASPVPIQPSRDGPVTSREVLGGLHHAYRRAA
jgi:putative transposase